MDSKIIFASYSIRINDNEKNPQLLDRFNGSEDFLKFFKKFTEDVYVKVRKILDSKRSKEIHFTVYDPCITIEEERCMYGYFYTGVGGDEYDIINTRTLEKEKEIKKHHAAYRTIFFYLYVPKNKNIAFLILQRRSNYGIKTKVQPILQEYLNECGFQNYRLYFKNIINASVMQFMLAHGQLKKISFTKRSVPESLEDFIYKNQESNERKGKLTVSLHSNDLGSKWRYDIEQLYKNTSIEKETVEIDGLDDSYDEIEFELDHQGKKKTFYIVNRSRVQPDINVTASIEFKDGIPTIDSLVATARSTIEDLFELNP